MSSRLEILIQYYKEDPSDPFNAYALATEYLKSNAGEAQRLFEELMLRHPSYVPTYYHAAKLFQEHGEREKAIATYEKGIEVAREMNDVKALRELRSAYDELVFE